MIKRYSNGLAASDGEYVLASDYDALEADYKRLDGLMGVALKRISETQAALDSYRIGICHE